MIKVGIIGGDSLVAGELIALLINHPDIELVFVESAAKAGCPVADVHGGLFGEIELLFTAEPLLDAIDHLFLCVTQGESRRFIETHSLPEELRIVDLSPDYRQDDSFIYGLPELNRKYIIRDKRVANAGSLSTAILLPLLPMAKNLLLNSEINVRMLVGSMETESHLFPVDSSAEDSDILCEHPHVEEAICALTRLQNSFSAPMNVSIERQDFPRGILTSITLDCPIELDMVKELYEAYYEDHNFVFIIDRKPQLKQIINTNKCLLYLEKQEGKLHIIAVFDQLLKGAAGQALHNMNLLFGLHERVGLVLKPFMI